MPQKKWTNADLPKVSRYGGPDLADFEEESKPPDLSDFEPLENVDMSAKPQTPFDPSKFKETAKAPEDTSAGQDVWTELNRPRTNVRQYTDRGADQFSAQAKEATKNLPSWLQTATGAVADYYANQGKAVGGFVDSLSSDLGLLQMVPAGKLMGVAPKAAELLHNINRAAGAGFAVSGGQKLLDSRLPWKERATGIADMLFGGMGALHSMPKPGEPSPTGNKLTEEFNKPIKPGGGPPPVDFEGLKQQDLLTHPASNHPYTPNMLDIDLYDAQKPHISNNEFNVPPEVKPHRIEDAPPKSLFDKSTEVTPNKIPFPKAENGLLDELAKNKQINYNNPRLEDVPLDNLQGSQEHLYPEKVQEYIEQGERPRLTEVPSNAKGRMDDQAPVVIRVGDQNILAGGHHRATADLANGKSSIQAIVYDADVPPELLDKLRTSVAKDATEGTNRTSKFGRGLTDEFNKPLKSPTAEELSNFLTKRKQIKAQANPEEDIFPKESRNFGDKRDITHYADDLVKTIGDETAHQQTLDVAENTIMRETDPEIIKDNFNQLEEYLLTEKNPDLAESYQFLRDVALDKVNKSRLRNQIRTSGDPDYFPKEMRAKQNPENVAMGGADERVLDVLGNSLYSKKGPVIAAKELLQNAIDEHKIAGRTDPIRMIFNHYDKNPQTGKPSKSVTIGDKGRGLTKEQIYTILTDVGKTGKLGEEGASGGFGFAKAAPMLGGEYSKFTSVVDEGGQRVKHTFEGTPKQLKNQNIGVPIKTEIVDPSTPTGFRAEVHYPDDKSLSAASGISQSVGHSSLGLKSPIHIEELYSARHPNEIEEYFNSSKIRNPEGDSHRIDPAGDIPIQDTIKTDGADIDVHYETPDPDSAQSEYQMDVLNNGMYQYTQGDPYSIHGALKGVPENIKFNVKANVPEGEDFYPFTANREQVSAHVQAAMKQWIKDNLVSGALQKQRQSLRDMYTNMHPLEGPIHPGSGMPVNARPMVLFDPDAHLTPNEVQTLQKNAFVTKFADRVDEIVQDALHNTDPKWNERIEKIGISLDPSHHGVWIPNPDTSGKATILINPFNFIREHSTNPRAAALETMSTMWHEVGHTAKWEDTFGPIDWSKVPSDAEGVGDFFKKYLDEVQHSKEVRDSGHGLDWLRATAEVYAKSGIESWNKGVDGVHDAFTSESSDRYAPEVSEALRIYLDRKRRAGAERNILSRTGISEEVKGSGEESIFGDVGPNGKRPIRPTNPNAEQLTTAFNSPIKWSPKVKPPEAPVKVTPMVIKQMQRELPGPKLDAKVKEVGDQLKAAKEIPDRDTRESTISKLRNFQRTLLTSGDLSAPGRQGLPLIGRKEWWTSWKPMFQAMGSEQGYNTVMDSIKQDPTGFFQPGQKGKSFANESGLSLTDTLDHREELFRSKWAEDFKGTGWFVKPSVRAYTAYLNKLRADTFKNMVIEAGAQNDIPTAKKIADYINVSTGRGNLVDWEGAARPLAEVFFSPRLTASRLQMYTRTFNPWYYADVPPVVRKNQLKSMLSLASTGLVIGQLAKGIGATVNLNDPDNSDFGKIKFGNTRIDPFGGHQQFLVAAARLLTGKTTSSTSGKTTSLTTGKFGMPTRASVFGNFMKNKLAPVPSFIWSWMEGKDFDGKDFNAKKEAMDRIVPIVLQDLNDIWKENPTLLQGLFASGSAFVGGGVQTYGR